MAVESKTSTTYKCDNCDVTVDVDAVSMGAVPAGWLTVNASGGGLAHLHSLDCLREWAENDVLDEETSRILTREELAGLRALKAQKTTKKTAKR